MDNALALDAFEVSVLLLWAAGAIYVGWRYAQCRSAHMLIVLVASLCIPGLGVCYAASQAIQNLTHRMTRSEE